jgi:lactoylglutathione lyase
MGFRIEHVALWTRDLERMREFYVDALDGRSGPLYENRLTRFRSYFIEFDEGARLELMQRPTPDAVADAAPVVLGYGHLAFRLGSRAAVDERVARLSSRGVTILRPPRQTGDGYYEAVVADPEANSVELMA